MSNPFKLTVSAALALCFAASACAKDFLIVAVPIDPPWKFYKEDGEQLTGIDIDVIQAVHMETGITFELKPMPFNRAVVEFRNGNVDILTGIGDMYATKYKIKRSKTPYVMGIEQHAYMKSTDDFFVKRYDHMYPHHLGVIKNFTYDERLNDDPLLTKDYSEDSGYLFGKLIEGQLDLIITNEWEKNYYLSTHGLPEQTIVPTKLKLEYNGDRYFGFSKNVDQATANKIDKALNKLTVDRVIDHILDRYWDKYLLSPAEYNVAEASESSKGE